MRLPKRLPDNLAKLLRDLEENVDQRVVEASMLRFKGGVVFNFTTVSQYVFVTIESVHYYSKYFRSVENDTSVHVRNLDVLRKEGMAS